MQSLHSLQHIGPMSCDPRKMSRLFVLLLAFLLHWNVVIGEQSAVNSLINLQKRIDYRTCIDRFDVHRDTIIQTDDSRKMGASFLYHVEAVNRDECLRVCCETDRCDVFVFEEKYQGSCFLFECGPPDDFRCQFAAHANYSIAVLSVQRYKDAANNKAAAAEVPPPPSPPKSPHLSQHELELDNLKTGRESFGSYRMPEMGIKLNAQPTVAPVTTTTTTTTTTVAPPPSTASVCGRFQFKCHSGECIAIYNACDGIPQCEDGSDETPACPSQPSVKSNKKHTSQMEEPPMYRNNQQGPQQHRPEENINIHNYSPDRTGPIQYPPRMYEGSDGSVGAGGYMSGTIEKPPPLIRNREDPMTGPRYYPVGNNNGQVQQQSQSARNQNLPIGKDNNGQGNNNNMIYNGNDPDNRLIYDTPHVNRLPNAYPNAPVAFPRPLDYYNNYPSNTQPLQPNINGQSNVPRPWPHPAADAPNIPFNNIPGQQSQPQLPNYPSANLNTNNNNWPTSIGSNNLPPAVLNPNSNNNGQSQQSIQNLPPISSNSAPQLISPAVNGIPVPANQPQQTTNNKSPPVLPKALPKEEQESESESSESAEESETTVPAPKKGKSRGKHRKLDKSDNDQGMPTFPPIYQQLKAIGSELDGEIMDHDGASDRPTGAVISLVIGVSITAVLAIFIGCRMKTVGRRIRRTGKGPYAHHDADFLVNGMYL